MSPAEYKQEHQRRGLTQAELAVDSFLEQHNIMPVNKYTQLSRDFKKLRKYTKKGKMEFLGLLIICGIFNVTINLINLIEKYKK
jgi:hypothetical protein